MIILLIMADTVGHYVDSIFSCGINVYYVEFIIYIVDLMFSPTRD